jgi:hypothetical protein
VKTTDLDTLTARGFVAVGEFRFRQGTEGSLSIALTGDDIPNSEGCYAFMIGADCYYVGHASNATGSGRAGLKWRLGNYRIPKGDTGCARQALRTALVAGKRITILILATPPVIEWHGRPINISLSLEAALIREFQPPWNNRGVPTPSPEIAARRSAVATTALAKRSAEQRSASARAAHATRRHEARKGVRSLIPD